MPDFDFAHHVQEFNEPLINSDMHDRLFTGSVQGDARLNAHAEIDAATAEGLATGKLLPEERYLTHKHNYDFHTWITIMVESLAFLKSPFTIADCAFGLERMDCHFVLTRT